LTISFASYSQVSAKGPFNFLCSFREILNQHSLKIKIMVKWKATSNWYEDFFPGNQFRSFGKPPFQPIIQKGESRTFDRRISSNPVSKSFDIPLRVWRIIYRIQPEALMSLVLIYLPYFLTGFGLKR